MTGILNIDKPPGISSAAAVGRVKRLLPRGTKVGHAGTLDPFATGVLLVLVGKATRCCELLMGRAKEYETVVRLDATTPTLDPTVAPEPVDCRPVSLEQVNAVLPQFTGNILQVPPAFSALKIGGRRAYQLARDGKHVALEARPVRVDEMHIVQYEWPLLTLRIRCGRGVYIRSLARDIGAALECGGMLTQLRRTRVEPYAAADGVQLNDLSAEHLADHLHPPPTPPAGVGAAGL